MKTQAGTQQLTVRHAGALLACCMQCLVPGAMILNAQGIFYPVVAADLDVQTAEITAWMSVAFISSAVFSLVVGNLLTRFRLKTMRLIGVMTAALALFAFSLSNEPWMFWLAALGAGYSMVLLVSLGPATLINRWFSKRVGMAMGVYASCSALGGVVFLMLGQAIIDTAGWRDAYSAFALIILVVCVPVELICTREQPQVCGLLPYGAEAGVEQEQALSEQAPEKQASAVKAPEHPEQALAEARRALVHVSFWLLIICGFLMNMTCQLHGYFPKYVLWVDEQAALGLATGAFVGGAVLASVCQTGSAIGKVVLGSFSDFSVRNAIIALASCGIVGITCVWLLPSTFMLPGGSLLYGFFLSSVLVLLPMLCREVFGSGEVYPIIYARVSVAATLGGALGNIVWPFLADNLGGFDAVFGVGIACMASVLICALLALLKKEDANERV